MTVYSDFCTAEASLRRIYPETARAVAESEGGLLLPAVKAYFPTGQSCWGYQLHYAGGPDPQAGLGDSFTKLTGWTFGEEAAWRDAMRYALNVAKRDGWRQWYGATKLGLDRWAGIDRSFAWDPNSQVWDFETTKINPEAAVYNAAYPVTPQPNNWACSVYSLLWALRSLGRGTSAAWLQQRMLDTGVVTVENGLERADGSGLVRFVGDEFGEFGFSATAETYVSIEDVRLASGSTACMIGGNNWDHWVGVRGSQSDGTLNLANPADGWQGIHQEIRDSWSRLGWWTLVVIRSSTAPPDPLPDPAADRLHSLETAVGELTHGDVRRAIHALRTTPLERVDGEVANIENRLDEISRQFLGQ